MEEIIFPNKLRATRKSRGIGMQQVADLLKISLSAVSKIERGYRRISQEQMIVLIEFLNCTTDDIFISHEKEEDKEVLAKWKSEAEKRIQTNESSGLKLFGAGIRTLRKERKINLADFAKLAKITVSVYHKIEVGQREIYKNELKSIASVFNMTAEEMVATIKEKSVKGELSKHLRKNQGEFRLTNFSDIANRGAKNTGRYKVPLYQKADSENNIIIDRNESTLTDCPIYLEKDWNAIYAVKTKDETCSVFPSETVLYADREEQIKYKDFAIMKRKRNDGIIELSIVKIEKDSDEKLYGVNEKNPEVKIYFSNSELSDFDRISFIQVG